MPAYNELTALYVGKGIPGGFQTLEDALEYVKELRRVGVGQPLSIRIAQPEYFLPKTLEIDSTVTRITIEPAGERVRLIGGVAITGFVHDSYNGVDCLSAPIPADCLTPEGDCGFTDLYVNGARAKWTRYPESGFLYAEAVENNEGKLFSSSRWFIAKPGDFRMFANMTRVQLSYCHYWIDEHTPVESYDPETRRVTFRLASRFFIGGDENSPSRLAYYLENVGEMFGKPGEWYADNGRVYYIPQQPCDPASLTAYAPTLSKLVAVEGEPDAPVSNIRFRNIDFAVTRGEYASRSGDPGGTPDSREAGELYASDAQAVSEADGSVTFRYAANCSVENCTLRSYGLHGFSVGLGCHGIRISRCEISDGGAGGVKMVGGSADAPASDRTYGNTLEDCHIHHCGRRYFAACGVLLMHTSENTVAHNHIHDLYYTGVSVGWVWGYGPSTTHDNLITKNHIHHLGFGVLSDMGGVYLLGIQPGTVVSCNLIHDIKSANYGGFGLYTDEGSSYMTLENNVVYNTSDNCYHQHYGSMNVVQNNIFAFSDERLVRVSRTEPHLCILFDRNIHYASGVPMMEITRDHIHRRTLSLTNNLYFDEKREPVLRDFPEGAMTLTDFQKQGLEEGSLVADPRFRDAAAFDFTLLPDSPALAMGFRPIDLSDVGVR